ncbi:hypothetical protein OE88DRAFT_792475 [Heliocybe sulcata]|uniref:Uncharacterized protein n=1 Tax=Heliocybe sulcata TaxID=5364 RepID=A0A5C3MQY4_9AGAM|nr:hypothetical protein OE88DRAFT_792475 [Heliocybe sulcata]
MHPTFPLSRYTVASWVYIIVCTSCLTLITPNEILVTLDYKPCLPDLSVADILPWIDEGAPQDRIPTTHAEHGWNHAFIIRQDNRTCSVYLGSQNVCPGSDTPRPH